MYNTPDHGRRGSFNRSQWAVAGVIVALAAARIAHLLITQHQLKQTAALFIGVPAFIALIITLTPRAQSTTGMVMKGITIALFASGIFAGEGLICIVMAAPIFYLVGFIVTKIVQAILETPQGHTRVQSSILLALACTLLSMEGVLPATSFNRAEVVKAERVLLLQTEFVQAALGKQPRFERDLPLFLQLGFPTPDVARMNYGGLAVGDRWVIPFTMGTQPMGELQLMVAARENDMVRFQMTADTTPIAGWLHWQEAEVRWEAQGDRQTKVTWTLHYDRLLDPAWYFAPLERYGVRQAANYLIETMAMP